MQLINLLRNKNHKILGFKTKSMQLLRHQEAADLIQSRLVGKKAVCESGFDGVIDACQNLSNKFITLG